MVEFPGAFVERMVEMLGGETPAFLEALARPEEGLRVNTLRVAPERFAEMATFDLRRSPVVDEGFVLAEGDRAGRHPHHAAGLYYLQDPGAMVVGSLADPRPGERVLDLAAAPGGKATHLAARMRNQGVLVANDIHRGRARELVGNFERCGVINGIVTSETPDRLARHFGPYFDRVVVDAPCSGESMFYKSAPARADWSEAAVAGCARRQDDILIEAAKLVVEGGILVYSTCTFGVDENERVVERFLERHGEYEVAEVPEVRGGEPLRLGIRHGDGTGGYRLWPHRFPGAGHFVCALRRREARGVAARSADPPASAGRSSIAVFRAFAKGLFPGWWIPEDRLAGHGSDLSFLPEGAAAVGGLHLLRTGLLLGTIAKHGFEPSHALAMAVAPAEVRVRLDLDSSDDRVEAYLRGHPLRAEGERGWTLVTVDGFALGWGKRTGDQVKNHYPKGLRWRG